MKRVGVLGGGQLGRMLGLAGIPLGLEFRFYDPGSATPVSGIGRHQRAAWTDDKALDDFAESVDVLTWEFENIPVATAERLARAVPTFPPPVALLVAQDRLSEKRRFNALGVPTNQFRNIESAADLAAAIGEIGLPAVLKTRRMGYDGKGQQVLRAGDASASDAEQIFKEMGEVPCLLEAFVPFDREVSLVGVRNASGETRFYPLVENVHVRGILHTTAAPAPDVSAELQTTAEGYLSALMTDLAYVGVMAIEFFVKDGGLLANEVAPRVHNSGHWTQDGAVTSQFENHLRAGLGLPLGSTEARGITVMLNLIGEAPETSDVFMQDGTRLHLYDKESRPGRKLGHVNVNGTDPAQVWATIRQIEAAMPEGAGPV